MQGKEKQEWERQRERVNKQLARIQGLALHEGSNRQQRRAERKKRRSTKLGGQ